MTAGALRTLTQEVEEHLVELLRLLEVAEMAGVGNFDVLGAPNGISNLTAQVSSWADTSS